MRYNALAVCIGYINYIIFNNLVLCLPNRRGYQGLAQLETIQANNTRIKEKQLFNENCHLL